jgi:glutamine synthetase
MIQGDHEDAPGQIRLNFGFDRAEQPPTTSRRSARSQGRSARSWAPSRASCRSLHGRVGERLPHNISLWRGDENAFLPDGRRHKPSQIGLNASAASSSTCGAHGVTASTVNSVPTLLGHGFLGAGLRRLGVPEPRPRRGISSPDRFEYRSVDSAVNPYLRSRALIKVMDDGIELKARPGEPEEGTSTSDRGRQGG